MLAVAGWVAANGPLTSGTVEEAAAVIWTLTSPEVHHMFRDDWGWSAPAYQDWLEVTLRRSLLP